MKCRNSHILLFLRVNWPTILENSQTISSKAKEVQCLGIYTRETVACGQLEDIQENGFINISWNSPKWKLMLAVSSSRDKFWYIYLRGFSATQMNKLQVYSVWMSLTNMMLRESTESEKIIYSTVPFIWSPKLGKRKPCFNTCLGETTIKKSQDMVIRSQKSEGSSRFQDREEDVSQGKG